MSSRWIYVGIWIFSVLISSFSQVLLKPSANKKHSSTLGEYLNIRVIAAYGIFFLSTLLTMLALRHVPYTYSPMVESMSYLFVPVFGVLILHEKISRRRMLGIGIMLAGILIYTL